MKNKLWFAHCLQSFTEILYCSRWQNTEFDVIPVFCQKGLGVTSEFENLGLKIS